MGGDPAAILAAFSSCFCGPWADATPHTMRNAPISFIWVTLRSFLARVLAGAGLLTRALSRRVLVQLGNQFRGRLGRTHRRGHNLPVLQPFAVECRIIV